VSPLVCGIEDKTDGGEGADLGQHRLLRQTSSPMQGLSQIAPEAAAKAGVR